MAMTVPKMTKTSSTINNAVKTTPLEPACGGNAETGGFPNKLN